MLSAWAGEGGTIDRMGLTAPDCWLLCKAVAELAADACVGRREVVDVAVGSWEAVEPSLAHIDENRRVAMVSRASDFQTLQDAV